MTKSEKKQEFEDVKKTVEAHGTLSEEVAEEKAKKFEEVTQELIEKDEDIKKLEAELEAGIIEKEERADAQRAGERGLASWEPKTKLGQEVKKGKIKNIDEILDNNKKILEEQIVDFLLDIKKDLILIGQAKGKFGGGKRRAWRQTQRKTMEGNVVSFSAMVVVGDKKGHVGVGLGKGKETKPAREKAQREARLGIQRIELGCGHFDCSCSEPHSIPYTVEGKCGSVVIKLLPAPQGTGLVIGNECKKILRLAGIKDVYSYTKGQGRTTINSANACMEALKRTESL